MNNWLIIADDLTGAADCAVAYRRHGLKATVGWGNSTRNYDDDNAVFSYNADSREMSFDESRKLQNKLLEQFWTKDSFLFRKIDSTLRGQPAADIVETIDFLQLHTGRGIGILAPAFPDMGRTTREGKVFVNDVALEETELWQRDHTYPTSDMKKIIENFAKVPCFVVNLEQIRDCRQNFSLLVSNLENQFDRAVLIFDAQTQDDLKRVASLFTNNNPSRFFIGSAGLAHAFASLSSSPMPMEHHLPKNDGGLMLVVGSLAQASRLSAKKLVAERDIAHFLVTPSTLLTAGPPLEEFKNNVTDVLKNGGNCLIEIAITDNLNMAQGPQLAKNLAHALKNSANHIAGFAATGGESASAFLDAFGVNTICLHDEIDTGISLGTTLGKIQIPIATKAGAFGDEMSLVHIFDRLAQIKLEGHL